MSSSPPSDGDKPAERPQEAAGDIPEADRTVPALPPESVRAAKENEIVPGSEPPPDPLLGTTLGGCRLDTLIGRGAMGAVYRASQLSLDRVVAVKTIRPDLMADPRIAERFRREARTVGRFNTPHVVLVHDVGQDRGQHYLVMEFVAGENLRQVTAKTKDKRLPTERAIRYLRQSSEGLKEAQRLGVLHRDIKPDNLLLDERDRIKIADFGIAKVKDADVHMTMTAELTGTPMYMSPEQCRAQKDVDFRSDMYSLGASFYYLLTGVPPAKGSSLYELIETKTKIQCLSPAKMLPGIEGGHPLSPIVEKMTAQDRGDRYASYDALIADLDRLAAGEKPVAASEPGPRPRPVVTVRRPARRGRTVAVAVVAVLAVAAGAFFAWDGLFGPAMTAGGSGEGETTTKGNAREASGDEDGGVPVPAVNHPGGAGVQPGAQPVDPPVDPPPGPSAAEMRAAKVLSLSEFEASFAAGEAFSALRSRAEPLVTDGDPEVATRASALLDDMEVASRVLQALRDPQFPQKPVSPEPPYTALDRYLAALHRAFEQPDAGKAYEAWSDRQLAQRRSDQELRAAALGSLRAHWQRTTAAADSLPADDTARAGRVRELQQQVADAVAGMAVLQRNYAVPEGELPMTAADLSALQAKLESALALANWNLSRDAFVGQLGKLGLDAWLGQEETLRAELTGVTERGGELDGADVAPLTAAVARLEGEVKTFRTLAKRVTLKRYDDVLAAVPEDAAGALGALRTAATTLEQAFELLATDVGKLEECERHFARAEQALQSIAELDPDAGAAAAHATRCVGKARDLRRAGQAMAVVPAGTVLGRGATQVPVRSFFLAPHEVTRRQFQAFATELETQCGDGADTERLVRAHLWLGDGIWPDAEALRETLRRGSAMTDRPGHPATGITRWDALAVARWGGRGMSLPRHEEWKLAALGSGGTAIPYPWGNEWSDTVADRNPFDKAEPVDQGGLAQRFRSGPQAVHHLAGNAAEWLLETEGENGYLAGGGFLDGRRDAREHARGQRLEWRIGRTPRPDFGARLVLRPADVFGELWN